MSSATLVPIPPRPRPVPPLAGVWRALDPDGPQAYPCADPALAASPGEVPIFPSAHPALNAVLPGGGWPAGLTEVLSPHPGLHEAALLAAAPTAPDPSSWWAWVVPESWPWHPHAPGWRHLGWNLSRLLWVRPGTSADAAWSVEQMLREGAVAGVVWLAPQVTPLALRRVHWAARSTARPVFVSRPLAQAQDPSPAPLRLAMQLSDPQGMSLELLKCPGRRRCAPVFLPHPAPLHTTRRPAEPPRRQAAVATTIPAAAAPMPAANTPIPAAAAPMPAASQLPQRLARHPESDHVVDRPAPAEAGA